MTRAACLALLLFVTPARAGQSTVEPLQCVDVRLLQACVRAQDVVHAQYKGCIELRTIDKDQIKHLERENATLRAEMDAMAKKFGDLSRRADAAIERRKPKKRKKR